MISSRASGVGMDALRWTDNPLSACWAELAHGLFSVDSRQEWSNPPLLTEGACYVGREELSPAASRWRQSRAGRPAPGDHQHRDRPQGSVGLRRLLRPGGA